jgi:hypothetical protein
MERNMEIIEKKKKMIKKMYCGLSWWIQARINSENILIPSFIRADGNSNENSPILLVFSKIKNQKKNLNPK